MSEILVSPSFLGIKDPKALQKFLTEISYLRADRLHIDFGGYDDFIPEKSNQSTLWIMGEFTSLPQELHLMTHWPLMYINTINRRWPKGQRNNHWVIIHPEAVYYDEGIFLTLYGFKRGLSLKPQTPVSAISPKLYDYLDLIMVMTVEPGKSGQKMIVSCLDKVRKLADLRSRLGLKFQIEVDGGINLETGQLAVNAGADILVSGGWLQQDPLRIQLLKKIKKEP